MQSLLESYATANAFIAHAADGKVDPREVEVIHSNVRRIGNHIGFSDEQANNIAEAAFMRYWETLSEHGPGQVLENFRAAISHLNSCSDAATVARIQDDLRLVARADGRVDDMEKFLIESVAAAWTKAHA